MASLGQKVKNLRSELQAQRVNAVEGNCPLVDPSRKGKQNATRFCNFCPTNGHTQAGAVRKYETKIKTD